MTVAIYTDVHVPLAIVVQLRRRGVDVLTAVEDGQRRSEDSDLLARATALDRLLLTQDIRFSAMAEQWQRKGRLFRGLLFAPQTTSIGVLVQDLELIAKASEINEWTNVVTRLPL